MVNYPRFSPVSTLNYIKEQGQWEIYGLLEGLGSLGCGKNRNRGSCAVRGRRIESEPESMTNHMMGREQLTTLVL